MRLTKNDFLKLYLQTLAKFNNQNKEVKEIKLLNEYGNNNSGIRIALAPESFANATQSICVPTVGSINGKYIKMPSKKGMNKIFNTFHWSQLTDYDQLKQNLVFKSFSNVALITNKNVQVIDYDGDDLTEQDLQELSNTYFNGQPLFYQKTSYGKHIHIFFTARGNISNRVKTFKIKLKKKIYESDIRSGNGLCVIQSDNSGQYSPIYCTIPFNQNKNNLADVLYQSTIIKSALNDIINKNIANQSIYYFLPKLTISSGKLENENKVKYISQNNQGKKVEHKKFNNLAIDNDIIQLSKAIHANLTYSGKEINISMNAFAQHIWFRKMHRLRKYTSVYQKGDRNSITYNLCKWLLLANMKHGFIEKKLIELNRSCSLPLPDREVEITCDKLFQRFDEGRLAGVDTQSAYELERATGLNFVDRHYPSLHSKHIPIKKTDFNKDKIDFYKDVCLTVNNRPYFVVTYNGKKYQYFFNKKQNQLERAHADIQFSNMIQTCRALIFHNNIKLNEILFRYNGIRNLAMPLYSKDVKRGAFNKTFHLTKEISDKLKGNNGIRLLMFIILDRLNKNSFNHYAQRNDDTVFKEVKEIIDQLNFICTTHHKDKAVQNILNSINYNSMNDNIKNVASSELTKYFNPYQLKLINYTRLDWLFHAYDINMNINENHKGYNIDGKIGSASSKIKDIFDKLINKLIFYKKELDRLKDRKQYLRMQYQCYLNNIDFINFTKNDFINSSLNKIDNLKDNIEGIIYFYHRTYTVPEEYSSFLKVSSQSEIIMMDAPGFDLDKFIDSKFPPKSIIGNKRYYKEKYKSRYLKYQSNVYPYEECFI